LNQFELSFGESDLLSGRGLRAGTATEKERHDQGSARRLYESIEDLKSSGDAVSYSTQELFKLLASQAAAESFSQTAVAVKQNITLSISGTQAALYNMYAFQVGQ